MTICRTDQEPAISTDLMKIASLWQSRGLVIDCPRKAGWSQDFHFSKKNKQSLSFSTCISSPPLSRVLRALQWVLQCLVAGVVLLRNSSKNGVDPFSPSLGEILCFISMTCPSLTLHFFFHHSKPASLHLMQCTYSTFSFVSSVLFLQRDLDCPTAIIVCSSPPQKLNEKRV